MVSTLAGLEALIPCKDVETLWTTFRSISQDYGFRRIIYGFTRYKTDRSFGDPQDYLVMSTMPRDYMEGFVGSGLYVQAPMVKWALQNQGTTPWLLGDPSELDETELRVLKFNHAHGVTAGYTISFPSSSPRFRGAMAVIGKPGQTQVEVNRHWAKFGRSFEALAQVFHLKILALPIVGGRHLTKRQKEVLEWVGDGKTTQDIADILGVTPATVEKHMRLARETMDVETTAQAVLKAAFLNQMYVVNNNVQDGRP